MTIARCVAKKIGREDQGKKGGEAGKEKQAKSSFSLTHSLVSMSCVSKIK